MSGALPPLPNTPSWRGAQLKEAQEQLYVYLFTVPKKNPYSILLDQYHEPLELLRS
jgi:hypothetical protein